MSRAWLATAAGRAGGIRILVDAGFETPAAHLARIEIGLDVRIRIRQLLEFDSQPNLIRQSCRTTGQTVIHHL